MKMLGSILFVMFAAVAIFAWATASRRGWLGRVPTLEASVEAECTEYERTWSIPSVIVRDQSLSLPAMLVHVAEVQGDDQGVNLAKLADIIRKGKDGRVYYVYGPAMTGKSAVIRLAKQWAGNPDCVLDLVNFGQPTMPFAKGLDELRSLDKSEFRKSLNRARSCRSIVVDSFDEMHPVEGEKAVTMLKDIAAPPGGAVGATVALFGRGEGYRQARRVLDGASLIRFPRYQFSEGPALDYILSDYAHYRQTANVHVDLKALRDGLARVLADQRSGWKVRCLFQAADAANKVFEELESSPNLTASVLVGRVYDSILQRAQASHRRPPLSDTEVQGRGYREYLCQLARRETDGGRIELRSDTMLRSWTLGTLANAEQIASYSGIVEVDPLPNDRIDVAFFPRISRLEAALGCEEPSYRKQLEAVGEILVKSLSLK